MTTYAKLRIIAFLALALVGLVSGVGWAGAVIEVRIDDLTDAPGVTLFPTQVFTPTIVPDTTGEFLHFTLPAFQNPSGTIFYSDLFEDVVGGTLSDRLLVIYAANGLTVDVRFASDPATNRVEDGTFQVLGQFQNYSFQVRSDRSDVPAPDSLLLLGSGLAALGGVMWRRCRRA